MFFDGRLQGCPLGLECPNNDYDECVNSEACYRWTQAWKLYEIFILGGLPPIYLNNCGRDDHDDWTKPEYGFEHLNNCDFLLYYAAKQVDFDQWKEAYYKLNRKYPAYVRKEHFKQMEDLRKSIDIEYAQYETTENDIPF